MTSVFTRRAMAVVALTTGLLGGAVPAGTATAVQARVNLHTLICYETEDYGAEGDELYLQINGRTVWSSSDSIDCDHDSPARMPVNRLANTGDRVSLYDNDFPDSDDHLGTDVVEGDRGTLVFNLDGALYNLDYGPA